MTGLEELPVVHVVREGKEKVERELFGGVREQIRWTGGVMVTESVEKLSGTGGWGIGSIAKCNLHLEPCFMHRNKRIDCGKD